MNQETAVVSNPKFNSVRALLAKMKGQFEMALPKHLSADRMMRVALTACSKNAMLLDCTQASLAGALMTAAQVGLEPDGTLGRAYLIPRKNNRKGGILEAHFQAGYLGLLDLCQRSGEIASVRADVVRKGDKFSYKKGLTEHLDHEEGVDNFDAPIIYVYAIIRTKSGGAYWDAWSAEKVEAHRRRFSKDTRDDSVWNTDWASMAKKTLLTAVSKLAPKSVEASRAVAANEAEERGEAIEIDVVDAVPPDAPPKTIADLKAKVKNEKSREPPQAATASAASPATATEAPAADPIPETTRAVKPDTAGVLVAKLKVAQEMLGDGMFGAIVKKYGADPGLLQYGVGIDTLKSMLAECDKAISG